MIHILWQATGSVLSYQSVKLVYCNLNNVCDYCLAVSQCVIPEHHSSPLTLKIIPDWARKIYLSETGLTGSNSQLDRTKRTAFPCIVHHRQIRVAVHNQTFGPSGREDIGTYGVTSALIFRFFLLLSTEYCSRSQHKPTIEPSVFFCLPSAIRFCPTHRVQDSTMTRSSAWLPIVEDDCHS